MSQRRDAGTTSASPPNDGRRTRGAGRGPPAPLRKRLTRSVTCLPASDWIRDRALPLWPSACDARQFRLETWVEQGRGRFQTRGRQAGGRLSTQGRAFSS